MKKILFSILIISILMSSTVKISANFINEFIDDINISLRGTVKMQKISNGKALDSNTKALNDCIRDLGDNMMNSIDNAINFDLDVIQALFIRNFNVISVLLLILLLSSLIVLPKAIKD
ncbi:hypothetical protein [uncultured Tissierella sp.]|uniref:hypothetical protein n=1 Tax=uncultured Tissierella sp. TaxID=448160 RepID=UPI002805E2A6|nr:hypothetical protein [uncultured Tissierella sp.]MDU5080545.1 hypothetical protein [Bacillota bacterium]